MSKKAKNGANKKLHSKLLKQKKTKERDSKENRKRLMRELNKKASDVKLDSGSDEVQI